MQIFVNSANIIDFGFKVIFDIHLRTITLDAAPLTSYNGSGATAIQGIAFAVEDQDGVEYAQIDWSAPQLVPATNPQRFVIDLSGSAFPFFFQSFKIKGAIKDSDGKIYETPFVIKTICEIDNLNDNGYVDGVFALTPDKKNGMLLVQENTLFLYNNQKPYLTSKTGRLYYPTGTIDYLAFAGTPFTTNLYSGEHRITCTSVVDFDLGDDVFVRISYYTDNYFSISINNRIADLLCCIEAVQETYLKHCETAQGQRAKNQMDEISADLAIGTLKEQLGRDASAEADRINKVLKCDCATGVIHRAEAMPVAPTINTILVVGAGGTNVVPSTNGNTVTYTVASNNVQVVKKDNGDMAFSISVDNRTSRTVKYVLSFNYTVMAGYILDAIAGDPSKVAQLNALITSAISLLGLNGKCILDLTRVNYSLQQAITSATLVKQWVVNGNAFDAPTGLYATDVVSLKSWLDSLNYGSYDVANNSGTLIILSTDNTNKPSTLTFTSPDVVVAFMGTHKTLVQVLQAIIDYLCNLTALQVALGKAYNVYYIDYNGGVAFQTLGAGATQDDFNAQVVASIYSLVNRINQLTAVTCSIFKAIFQDNPAAEMADGDRVYGTLNGGCASLTDKQLAKAVIKSINKYPDVKDLYCAIDCSTPATCPEITGINMSRSVGNIAVYGITFSHQPIAAQTIILRYRIKGDTNWNIAASALTVLQNGNVSNNPPFLILNPTAGKDYEVWAENNCGGTGFVGTITIPTGVVYNGYFRLDSVLYNVCGDEPVQLYSSEPFGTGVAMFTDAALTTPVTDQLFIATIDGSIFNISSTTGVVGSNTDSNCNAGIAGSYILGNNSGTVCSGTPTTLYTAGNFQVGTTLYTDQALSTPVSGFSYVVNMADNHIYNLNSTTGVVISDTGTSCSSNTFFLTSSMAGMNVTNVFGIAGYSYPGGVVGPGGSLTGTHSAFSGPISVTVAGTLAVNPSNMTLFINNVLVECITVNAAGTYQFASRAYLGTDVIKISLGLGHC